nr:movement protein p7B [Tolivirales sp.]WRQ65665.1 movement protein 2 (P7B protein) [Tolivirales sp.]
MTRCIVIKDPQGNLEPYLIFLIALILLLLTVLGQSGNHYHYINDSSSVKTNYVGINTPQ